MSQQLIDTLGEKTIHAWLQAQEALGEEFYGALDNLAEYLKEDESGLARYLLEAKRRPSKIKMSQLIMQLINAKKKNLQEAYKQITALRHIVIAGNDQAIWELEIPSIPILAKREKGKFTPKRFSNLPRYSIWKDALDSSVLDQEKLSETAEIGQALLSAVIYGGLINSHLLAGLLKNINKPPGVFNNRAYIDLSLSWLGHQGAEHRRWFPDALSEALIWKLSAGDIADPISTELNQNALTKVVFNYISSFFIESTLDKVNRPRNITEFLDSCALKYDLMLPPFISNYCQRKHISHSMRQCTWDRIESVGRQLETDEITSDLTLEHWVTSPKLTEDDLEYEQNNSKGLSRLPLIPSGLSNIEMRSQLHEMLLDYEDHESMVPLLLKWGIRLLEVGKRGRPAPKPNTVKGYIASIGNRLFECLGDERLIDQDAGTIEDIYTEVLEDIDSKGLRKKVAQLLYQFHTYLVKQHHVVEIEYRSVLGASSAPTPVDANLLLTDEFNQLLNVIEDSDLILNHPKMVTATKLLAILGYRCGLRRSEALKLRLIDVHGDHDPMLMIRPFKFRRLKTTASKRVLPLVALLEPEELKLLKEWIINRKKEEEESAYSQYLFSIPEKNYGCISEDLVFPAIHAAMRATTGDDSLRYHHFRHSFASLTLLRLMIADHGIPQGIFEYQPEMLKWLEQSEEFRNALYCRSELTRRHLYYVAFLLGHSSPDVTLEHYVHTLDIISSHLIAKRFQPKQNLLIAASGLPQSTAYRLSKAAPEKLLIKIRKSSGFEPVKRRGQSTQRILMKSESPQGYKIYSNMWKLLFLYSARDVSKHDLCERFKVTDQEFEQLLNNLKHLESFTSNDRRSSRKFKMMEQKDGFGDTKELLCPRRPRLHLDKEVAVKLSNALYKLSKDNVNEFEVLIGFYVKSAWSTKYLAVFKDAETANCFLSAFSRLDLPKDWVRLSVLVGQTMAEKDMKKSMKAWRRQLELAASSGLENARITDGSSMGDHGWLGINLEHPEMGRAGLAQRYSFIMSMIFTGRSGVIDVN